MQVADQVHVARDETDLPDPPDGTSRRALLTGLGLIAGAAGLTGFAGRPVRDEATTTSPTTTNQTTTGAVTPTRHIYGADWRIVRPGVAPGTMPPIGTPSLPHGRLVDAHGADIGRFDASAMPTSGNGINLHHLAFSDGTITAVGPSTFDDASFAVIGGTGVYSGVAGSYQLHQEPAPSGGTAVFTLDIKIPEA